MNTVLVIIVSVSIVAAAAAILAVVISRSRSATDAIKRETALILMQNQLKEIRDTLDTRLADSQRDLSKRFDTHFDASRKIITEVTERLTKLDETNRQVVSFADQLRSLQDILKNPKQRGILGEYYLETVLKNVMPPGSYEMQYAMPDGTIVDAAVFVKDKIIPIDSKFSLENYNRIVAEQNEAERARLEKVFIADLKTRITETAKYIQPANNTMEFAFMFIPHEAIYYDLLTSKIGASADGDGENLIQRAARTYKVIIVSPTSFLAYLQTVLQGLRAMQIEETAKDIIKRVGDLGKHLKTYEDYYSKMGASLKTTVNHYNAGYKELGKIDKDVLRISGERAGLDPVALDRPHEGIEG